MYRLYSTELELLNGLPGPELLNGSYECIGQNHAHEHHIPVILDQDQTQCKAHVQKVEKSKAVFGQDHCHRLRLGRCMVICRTAGGSVCNLLCRQAG